MSVTWKEAKEGWDPCVSRNVAYETRAFEYAYVASACGVWQRIEAVQELVRGTRSMLVSDPVWWNPISWFPYSLMLPWEEYVCTRPRAGRELYVPADINEQQVNP